MKYVLVADNPEMLNPVKVPYYEASESPNAITLSSPFHVLYNKQYGGNAATYIAYISSDMYVKYIGYTGLFGRVEFYANGSLIYYYDFSNSTGNFGIGFFSGSDSRNTITHSGRCDSGKLNPKYGVLPAIQTGFLPGTDSSSISTLPGGFGSRLTPYIHDLSSYIIDYLSTNGTISGPSSAASDDTVTLTVTPDTGYALSSIAIYKTASQDPIAYTKVNDTTYTFVMPDTDVSVTGIFARAYSVSIACSPSSFGTVSVTPSSSLVRPNTPVNFTVTPNSGVIVSTVDFSAGVNVEWNAKQFSGSFIMPERLVYGTIFLTYEGDPNAEGGTSQPEIPEGDFNNISDNILVPPTGSNGIISTTVSKGFVTMWNPTNTELEDIGSYLYSTDWGDAVFNGIRNLFGNPAQSIIALSLVPYTPTRSSTKALVNLGKNSTGVNSYQITNQFTDVDLGTIQINKYWDSYLDYNPYTSIQLFLPFIGTVTLDPDIVMGQSVGIKYRFDACTGSCVAFLYTLSNSVQSVFAEHAGYCALNIPVTSADHSRFMTGIIRAVASVAAFSVTHTPVASFGHSISNAGAENVVYGSGGTALNSLALPAPSMSLATRMNAGTGIGTANTLGEAPFQWPAAGKGGFTDLENGSDIITLPGLKAELQKENIPYAVNQVLSGKVNTMISGSFAGGVGMLGSVIPYVIIRRPKQSLAENYKHYVGYPSNVTAKLGTLSGYTKIEQADLEGIPCTDMELAMIYDALKGGVYL